MVTAEVGGRPRLFASAAHESSGKTPVSVGPRSRWGPVSVGPRSRWGPVSVGPRSRWGPGLGGDCGGAPRTRARGAAVQEVAGLHRSDMAHRGGRPELPGSCRVNGSAVGSGAILAGAMPGGAGVGVPAPLLPGAVAPGLLACFPESGGHAGAERGCMAGKPVRSTNGTLPDAGRRADTAGSRDRTGSGSPFHLMGVESNG